MQVQQMLTTLRNPLKIYGAENIEYENKKCKRLKTILKYKQSLSTKCVIILNFFIELVFKCYYNKISKCFKCNLLDFPLFLVGSYN